MMRRVILESPYAGDIERNVAFARACVRDALFRGESPLAFHILYAQPGILDDAIAVERKLGIEAGHAWMPFADAVVVYIDNGVSEGMRTGIDQAVRYGLHIERRRLGHD